MKFPRNSKFLHGQLDAAPFACVLFLLVIFVALSRNWVYTPGVAIRLPEAVDLAGTPNAIVAVAIDAGGQLYYEGQVTTEDRLRQTLKEAVQRSREPLTLVMQADKDVRYETLVRLGLLAREAQIKDALLATRPDLSKQAVTPP